MASSWKILIPMRPTSWEILISMRPPLGTEGIVPYSEVVPYWEDLHKK